MYRGAIVAPLARAARTFHSHPHFASLPAALHPPAPQRRQQSHRPPHRPRAAPTRTLTDSSPSSSSTAKPAAAATDANTNSDSEDDDVDVDDDEQGVVPVTERSFDYIQASVDGRVAIVEIHRPRELNALSAAALREVADAVVGFDADPAVRAIVLTGSPRVFAAGSDVAEQLDLETVSDLRHYLRSTAAADGKAPLNDSDGDSDGDDDGDDLVSAIDQVAAARKPVVAAVAGFALGVGCELALAADIIIAAEDAAFGAPHVQLGTVPAEGATQRLARAVGKAKAMELVLTGRQMTADEAERAGLVARVAPKGEALAEAKDVAAVIARHSAPVVAAAKTCVNTAFETPLAAGRRFERRQAAAAFTLKDRREGLKAFVDNRKPKFSNR